LNKKEPPGHAVAPPAVENNKTIKGELQLGVLHEGLHLGRVNTAI
jgi:hypothetical protein